MRNETITKTIEKVYKDSQMVGYVYKETLALYVKNKKNILRISIKTSIDPDYDYAKFFNIQIAICENGNLCTKLKQTECLRHRSRKLKLYFILGI